MATIIINNEYEIKGKVSVSRVLNEEKNGFIIQGVLATHLYIEELKAIEIPRFKVSNIEVYQENFGSDDFNIMYYFRADYFKLKDKVNNGLGSIIDSNEIERIEDIIYKDEHSLLGDLGENLNDNEVEEVKYYGK